MGRTVPAITLEFQRQQKAFDGFRRALKRSDQLALDILLSTLGNPRKKQLTQRMFCHLRCSCFVCYWKSTRKEVMRLRQEIKGVIEN